MRRPALSTAERWRGLSSGSLLQMLAEKRLDVVPQLIGRAFAIARPVIGNEGVAGALVDLGGHVLAGRLAALLQLGFQRHRRVLVFFAEHAEQRTMQLADHV